MRYNKIIVIHVDKLIWDDWNIDHISKHQVVPLDVEQVCHNLHIVKPTYKNRLLMIGKTNKDKVLAIVLDQVSEGTYYVVTARTADKKEVKLLYDSNE